MLIFQRLFFNKKGNQKVDPKQDMIKNELQDKYSVGLELGNSPDNNYGKEDDDEDEEDIPNYLKGEQFESGEVFKKTF